MSAAMVWSGGIGCHARAVISKAQKWTPFSIEETFPTADVTSSARVLSFPSCHGTDRKHA